MNRTLPISPIVCAIIYIALGAGGPKLQAQPNLQISGYNWGAQWVTTFGNDCTKNRTNEYIGLVAVWNSGNMPVVINSFDLTGVDADTGFFSLDVTDPATTIRSGAMIMPATPGDTPFVYQKVIFRPRHERDYEASIIVGLQGSTSIGAGLWGIGVESRGEFLHTSLDTMLFDQTSLVDTVRLHAAGGHQLTVTDLRIIGDDASDFKLETGFAPPTLAKPWTIRPDSSVTIPVLFEPATVGRKTARIVFTGNHSICVDSSATLIGFKRLTLGVEDDRAGARRLEQNAPNPFAQSTTIRFTLPRPSHAKLTIHAADGAQVATALDGRMEAGVYETQWNADGLSGGIYFYRLTTDGGVETRTMIITR